MSTEEIEGPEPEEGAAGEASARLGDQHDARLAVDVAPVLRPRHPIGVEAAPLQVDQRIQIGAVRDPDADGGFGNVHIFLRSARTHFIGSRWKPELRHGRNRSAVWPSRKYGRFCRWRTFGRKFLMKTIRCIWNGR